jgi:carbon storage regulator
MLILTRRIDEAIVIGENVKITVRALRGNQVRLGIEAPEFIMVHREEVFERIQQALVRANQRNRESWLRRVLRANANGRTTPDEVALRSPVRAETSPAQHSGTQWLSGALAPLVPGIFRRHCVPMGRIFYVPQIAAAQTP